MNIVKPLLVSLFLTSLFSLQAMAAKENHDRSKPNVQKSEKKKGAVKIPRQALQKGANANKPKSAYNNHNASRSNNTNSKVDKGGNKDVVCDKKDQDCDG